jgi:Protein of unknown function (DUF3604)
MDHLREKAIMHTVTKGFFLLAILITAYFSFPRCMQSAKDQASAPVQDDVWEPFQPVRNTTFRVVIDPHAQATLNSEYTWALEWRPQRYVYPGTQIELRSVNLHAYYLWKYTKIGMEGAGADITFRRRAARTSLNVRAVGGKWIIARARLQYGLRVGEPLRVNLTAVPPYVADHYDAVEIWYCEPVAGSIGQQGHCEFIKDLSAQAILNVGPGPVQRLTIYSHPMAGSERKVRTVLNPEDRYGNPTEFHQSVPVELQWEGKTWTEQVKGFKTLQIDSPEDVGRLKASIPMRALDTSENISNGLREGGRLVVTDNPVWPSSPDGKLAAFGEFHWHTEISGDGIRSLPEGLAYARDHLNLNYVSPSDHTPTPDQWKYTVSVLNRFNGPDRFATFFGYEHSTHRGHENYYFTDPSHPISPLGMQGSSLRGDDDLTSLAELLNEYDTTNDPFIAIPHHTNAVSETRRLSDDTPYWFQYPWTRPAKYHRLAEILQMRGNMERDTYPEDGWRGWYTYGASVQDGLEHGYKLGFTAGSDNHTAGPGNGFFYYENASRIPPDSISLTGIWTDRVERASVFSALYARHTWAVWDTRAIVYFTVNAAPAGTELEVRKGEPLIARVKMSAEDALQSIEIVSDKKPVWVASEDELDFDLKVPLGHADHSTYFYLRALQRNGGIVYASPVFIVMK